MVNVGDSELACIRTKTPSFDRDLKGYLTSKVQPFIQKLQHHRAGTSNSKYLKTILRYDSIIVRKSFISSKIKSNTKPSRAEPIVEVSFEEVSPWMREIQ
jgi:hypothetical protein